ncbi:MAG: PAS domain-containing protein [Thalassobaculum sp.]|uniref:PAS domain-containing protein n=1 Tax=Thalassobaculum sp. TaxID=2022740 RepID=UPI0032EC1DC2
MDRERLAGMLLRGLPDALIVSDAEGIIEFWNAAAERVFGFSVDDALGSSLDIIIPERLRARHWSGYAETMKTGHSRYGAGDLLAVPALHKDGRRLSIQFSIMILRDDRGRPTGTAAVLRDVTHEFEARRKLERDLAELRRAAADNKDEDTGASLGCPGHWRRQFGSAGDGARIGPAWLPKAD